MWDNDSRYLPLGQQFISLANTLKVHYITSSSITSLPPKRGFRFSYSFIENESRVTSVVELPALHLGKVANLNYPHDCPNDYHMFIKSEIGHQIELRLPRLTYMKITDGPNCESNTDRLLFHLVDPFGDVSLTPPNPTFWSVCSESSEPFKTFSALRSTRIKIVRSKFHVLHIRPMNGQRNTFMFYYKTRKGEESERPMSNESHCWPDSYDLVFLLTSEQKLWEQLANSFSHNDSILDSIRLYYTFNLTFYLSY